MTTVCSICHVPGGARIDEPCGCWHVTHAACLAEWRAVRNQCIICGKTPLDRMPLVVLVLAAVATGSFTLFLWLNARAFQDNMRAVATHVHTIMPTHRDVVNALQP
jgi:hypothetical protein